MRRLPFVVLVLASLGGLCNPRNPPMPDACDHPADVAADAVEIGTGDDSTFVAIHDGDLIQPIFGPQGGTMIPIRLRLTGANTPACVSQSTVLWRPTADLGGPSADLGSFHEDLATSSSPLKTYAQPDGSFLTKPNYLVVNGYARPGEAITITVEAGQKTNSRSILFGSSGPPGS